MAQQLGVDVIVTADRDPTAVEHCLQSLLAHGGPALRRLIVIDDASSDPDIAERLSRLATVEPKIHVVRNASHLGPVASCNLGLSERQGDVVLVNQDCRVGPEWLSKLAAVAHAEERTACATPLTQADGLSSLKATEIETTPTESALATISRASAGLPRWTAVPTISGLCVYLRGDVIDAVGLLNAQRGTLEASVAEWIGRAAMLGFGVKRANHVYVHRTKMGNDASQDNVSRIIDQSSNVVPFPDQDYRLKRFERTLDAQLAGHAVRVESTGRVRVALDLRHLPREQVGTRTYAVGLGRSLAAFSDIDLTLLVRDPAQASAFTGRVVTEEQWSDDVDLIHKPAQVIVPQELKLLFESSAHVVITYQDLIGFQIPSAFSNDFQHERYVGTSSLSIPAVQRVIAYSENAKQEISAAFAVPAREIDVISLGVEAGWFGKREAGDSEILQRLRVPSQYFFSIATDFPHKNLPNLLDAYAHLRRRWPDTNPPGLILAGHTSSARTDFYPTLESRALPEGVMTLGSVTGDQLRVLYQHALALVFPSLYEGFGLPPLEAMAAGTPVIAMPISAVPEIGGDAVLYADGLSAPALARAMEAIGVDERLRADLRARGKARVDAFRWEQTARATAQVYRSVILHPSERSLQMRRQLQPAIIRWSETRPAEAWLDCYNDSELFMMNHPVGIKNALKALNASLQTRLRRELKKFQSASGRASA